MTLPAYLRPRTPAVKSEVLDGELVLIDFDSGAYYSGNHVAGAVWQLLQVGTASPDVGRRVAAHFAAPQAEADVARLLAFLLEANLVVPAEAPPESFGHELAPGAAYEDPALERFEDMAELLVLDPIHEVEEEGWPHRPRS